MPGGVRKKRRPKLPREITHYPKRNEVARIRKKHPDSLVEDEIGRLYGKSSANPVREALEAQGDVDGETRLFWWVHLPRRRLDPRATSERHPDPDDAMEFPTEGDWIGYHPYLQPDKSLGSFRVVSFPERIGRNGRSASVVVEVSK